MKKQFLTFVLVLALGTIYAVAQYQDSRPNPQSGSPSMSQSSSQDQSMPVGKRDTIQVDDQTLTTKLHQQFDTVPDFKRVLIAVADGKVNLTGTVPSKDDRNRAKDMAASVPGVRSVREKLNVDASSAGTSSKSGVPGAPAGSTAMKETANNTAGSIAGNSNSTSASTAGQMGAAGEASGTAASNQASQSGTQSGGIAGTSNATGAATDKSGATANTGAVGAPTAGVSGQTATTAASDTSALHGELDSAFQSEPTLSTSHIVVNVSDTVIELTGSVPTAKERLTAKRIAQSYAENRKVDEKLTVTGRGGNGATQVGSPGTTGSSSGTDTKSTGTPPAMKDPSMNPPANDNQQPPPPPGENPKTQGDQSTSSPR